MDYYPNSTSLPTERENSVSTSKQEFLFVNSSSASSAVQPGQYKGHKDVRRFVMQKARRARPWSTSKQPERQTGQSRRNSRKQSPRERDTSAGSTPLSSQGTPGEVDSDPSSESSLVHVRRTWCEACKSAPRMQEKALCSTCWRAYTYGTKPRDLIGATFDPFGTLPVSGDAQSMDPYLWEQFRMMASISPIPVDLRQQSNVMLTVWTSAALKHTAFLHSLLCAAALYRYSLGQGSYFSVEYHKSKAIAGINACLSDPSGLSDENIGAVFMLLCIEMGIPQSERDSESQKDEVMVHLNGLRRMVDLRGGLGNLRSNRCLESFILRHSIINSIASFDAPYLLPYDSGGNFCSYLSPPRHFAGSDCKLALQLRQLHIDEGLIDNIYEIAIFIAALNEWYAVPSSPLDPLDLQNQAGVLQCRLMQWLHDDQYPRPPLDSALCIALIIFLVMVTERYEPTFQPLHYSAIPRLRDALLGTDLNDWVEAPELLLWTTSIATLCVCNSMDVDVFSERLAFAVQRCNINSFEGLHRVLQGILWVPHKLDEIARTAWLHFMNPQHLQARWPMATQPEFVQMPQYPFLLSRSMPSTSRKQSSTPTFGSRSSKRNIIVPVTTFEEALVSLTTYDASEAIDAEINPFITDLHDILYPYQF